MNLDTDLLCLLQSIIMKGILNQDEKNVFLFFIFTFISIKCDSLLIPPSVLMNATAWRENSFWH